MKKNGYLRRFLALFLALVMIMADSSVTTFAATVGRVRQQNATQKVTPTPGNSNTYRDVLGGAVNYGIVTTRLILGGHIDTNFAAGSWNLILLRTLLRLENTRAKIIQEILLLVIFLITSMDFGHTVQLKSLLS